jgi:hypothetical protein
LEIKVWHYQHNEHLSPPQLIEHKKGSLHMMVEVHVMVWDRHNNMMLEVHVMVWDKNEIEHKDFSSQNKRDIEFI